MDTIVSIDELIAKLADYQRIKEENAKLKKAIVTITDAQAQNRKAMEGLTAQWNVLVVMGQVSDTSEHEFTIAQGEQDFIVAASGHPCKNGDWIMVVGNLTVERGTEDPDSFHLDAYRIEGIATSDSFPKPAGDVTAVLG